MQCYACRLYRKKINIFDKFVHKLSKIQRANAIKFKIQFTSTLTPKFKSKRQNLTVYIIRVWFFYNRYVAWLDLQISVYGSSLVLLLKPHAYHEASVLQHVANDSPPLQPWCVGPSAKPRRWASLIRDTRKVIKRVYNEDLIFIVWSDITCSMCYLLFLSVAFANYLIVVTLW